MLEEKLGTHSSEWIQFSELLASAMMTVREAYHDGYVNGRVGNVVLRMSPVEVPGAPNPMSGLDLRISCLLPLGQSCTENKPGMQIRRGLWHISKVSDPVIRRSGPVDDLHHVLLPHSGCVPPPQTTDLVGLTWLQTADVVLLTTMEDKLLDRCWKSYATEKKKSTQYNIYLKQFYQ